MLNQDQINDISALVSRTAASLGRDGKGRHSLYNETTALAEKISVHFKYGADPSAVIGKARPYEPDEVHEYRISSQEQGTFAYASKILGLEKGAIFNPQEYSLEFPEDAPALTESKGLIKDYLLRDIPGMNSIEEYAKDVLLKNMQIDPNGFFVLLPKTPEYKIFDSSILLSIKPKFVPSSHVVLHGVEAIGGKETLFLLAESSDRNPEVKYRGSKGGYIFFLFLPNHTLRLVEVEGGTMIEPRFEIEVYHEHNAYEQGQILPFQQSKGVLAGNSDNVLSEGEEDFYISHIQGVIPHLNSALKTASDLAVAITNHLHPQKWEVAIDCPDCGGLGHVDGETCRTCHGTGKTTLGASGAISYIIEPPEDGKTPEPAGYIQVQTAVITEARGIYRDHILEALRAVNMEMLFDNHSRANQTAESKSIDREQLHNHLRQVAATVFPVYQWILDGINVMRYGKILNSSQLEQNRVIAKPPITYDTMDVNSGIARIQAAQDAELPKGYILKLVEENISRTFREDSESAKLALAYLKIDPLPLHTFDEILAANASGAGIPEEDVQLKGNIVKLVNEAYSEDSAFLDMSVAEQRERLLERLRTITAAQDPQTPEPITP